MNLRERTVHLRAIVFQLSPLPLVRSIVLSDVRTDVTAPGNDGSVHELKRMRDPDDAGGTAAL